MTDSADERSTSQSGLACWYCGDRLQLQYVLRDGILRSRSEREGGPYRLFVCPTCLRANLCEKTGKKRWFSSPSFRPNLLDYLVGRLFLPHAEDFLRAVTWFRENEERRRYFFERDGDGRYSSGGLLWKLWPLGREGERAGGGSAARGRRRGRRPPRPEDRRRPRAPRVASPWEILGLEDGASEEEIRSTFHRLAVQYHPDKVHHLGEEFQRIATAKFKDLQRAYEALLQRKDAEDRADD